MHVVPPPAERSRAPVYRNVNQVRHVIERYGLTITPVVGDALNTLTAWANHSPVTKSRLLEADESAPLRMVNEVLPTRQQRHALMRIARFVDGIDADICANHPDIDPAAESALKSLCRWTDPHRLVEIGAVQAL